MAVRDKYPVTECDNCGADCVFDSIEAHKLLSEGRSYDELVVRETDYVAVNNGFCLDLTGHYSGFTDDMGGKLSHVVLCHDCSLAVARALPGIFKPSSGHHSMFYDEAHTSCCEFAWSIDHKTKEILVGDGEGGWKKDVKDTDAKI